MDGIQWQRNTAPPKNISSTERDQGRTMGVADLHFSHEEHNSASSPVSVGEKELDSLEEFFQPGQAYRPDLVIFQEPIPLP